MEFTTFVEFLKQNGGLIFALLGAALAALFAGIGSAKGVGIVGQSTAGLITEDPEKFGQSLILQVIPGTQGFYGFITALIILNKIGILSGNPVNLTLGQGFMLLMASLPMAFVGYSSAISQGKTAAAGIQILAKRPEKMFNGVIYAVMVETYAVVALITSILMIVNIKL
ncbi:V-type ATP synthase subunit K [Caloramator sp. mosi_1]|uniref:V-type ATP synthase subunit K n=1 Tax=Caloramator sp. mosi_1 TaxID=3023090 RepID=UPI002362D828|nr:V-type ATP synthase subunit K [Caloramator sp. mosi_1]WDC83500.1 V-type ATP synthase subunit K [Caloramator sp. mosi_1]